MKAHALNQQAIEHLRRADAVLGRVIERVGPCPLKPRITARAKPHAPYAALVRSIAYQQLNGRVAETIFGRVLALFPGCDFPLPQQLLDTPDEHLRRAGLSRAKAASVKDIAAHVVAGVVPASCDLVKLTDEEVLERLTVIRGVGPWTVQMLLMFHLGRPDVLPATDYGVRQGFKRVYAKRQLPEPKHILKHGERWRPYRSVASWYLWRALEMD